MTAIARSRSPLAAALPEGTARWRFELAGEHVGVVDLSIRCLGEACTATWTSERRPPAEAGGAPLHPRGRGGGGSRRALPRAGGCASPRTAPA